MGERETFLKRFLRSYVRALGVAFLVAAALLLAASLGAFGQGNASSVSDEDGPGVASPVELADTAIRNRMGFVRESGAGSVTGYAADQVESADETVASLSRFNLSGDDVAHVAGGEAIATFGLCADFDAPQLDAKTRTALETPIEAMRARGKCSALFVNTATGRGIAYNPEEQVFVASSVKAVVAYYIVSKAESEGSELPDWVRTAIEAAIVESDNAAYQRLVAQYCDARYGEWFARYDDSGQAASYLLFPNLSARSLAAFWTDFYHYLQKGSDNARWLAGLFASADRSFIRDGVAGKGVSVWSKAGWVHDEADWSTSDAGIVEIDGVPYIVAIVTSQQFTDESAADVAALARAFVDARGALDAWD